MKSIQDQYKFVHLVLLECLVAEPSSIACDGHLEANITELHQSGALLRRFKHMYELSWQDQALRSTSTEKNRVPAQANKSKNRSQKIVPGKQHHTNLTGRLCYKVKILYQKKKKSKSIPVTGRGGL
jgi:hypothetical protein